MPELLPAERLLVVIRDSPLTSIDLVVRNEIGEVLLGLRTNRPAQGNWFVPGGRILKGESLEAAFERIAEKELGRRLPLHLATWLGVYEHFYEDNFAAAVGVATHYIVLAYTIESSLDLDLLPEDQHGAYRWFSESEVLANSLVHENTKAYFR